MANEKLYVKSPFPNIEGGDPLYIDRELGKIEIGFQKVERAVTGTAVDQDARDDISNLQTRVSTLEVTNGNAAALVEEERTARIEGDTAEATARLTLKAQVDENTALLEVEQTARVTADQALAEQVTTLETDYMGNKASVAETLTALSTQTEAIAEGQLLLEAQVELNTAGLIEERIARVTDIESVSADITSLQASFNENSATVNSSLLALTNADVALGQQITNLNTLVGENNATIYGELSALSSFDQSLSQQVETVSAKTNTKVRTFLQANPPVGSLANPLTEGDMWFDTDDGNKPYRYNGQGWVDVQDDDIEVVAAAVTNETNARVAGDQANANAIQTVTTTVNGLNATVSTLSQSVNGVSARWGVTINNNGAITGIELNSGADQKSTFRIQADKFQLEPQGGATVSPFYVEGGVTYIENAVIKNGSLTQIASSENAENDLYISVQMKEGARVSIVASHMATGNLEVANGTAGDMYVHVNGGVIMRRPLNLYRYRNNGFFAANQPTTYQVTWSVPADGVYTFWLANRPGTGYGSGSAMTIIEQRK